VPDKNNKPKQGIVSKRSEELTEILFIEEKLHELKSKLVTKDYDSAKEIYKELLSKAKKIKYHKEEKIKIYRQLKNAATILSFALRGSLSTKTSPGKFVDLSPEPINILSDDDRELALSTKTMDEKTPEKEPKGYGIDLEDESMKKYLEALEAIRKKEKAKALELLIGLVDKHPDHVGLKTRLREALELKL
jgi:hypothetical protein